MDGWFLSNMIVELLIALASIVGNIVVLMALYREKSLHTVTNCLIASLASADLLTGLGIPLLLLPFFGLPSEFYSCVFLNCLILMLTGISNLHLLAIAVERFIAIKIPFWYHANFTLKIALFIALVNWVLGITLGLVPLMGWNNGWNNTCGFVQVISLEQHVYFHFFGVIVTPMVITLLIYISIFIEVKRSSRQIEALKVTTETDGGGGQGKGQGKSGVKAEVRAAKRFALVIGIFGLCWFPLEILNCIDIWTGFLCIDCIIFTVWLSHMNSVINPFLYAYGNSTLRKAMISVIRGRRTDNSNNEMSMTSSTSA